MYEDLLHCRRAGCLKVKRSSIASLGVVLLLLLSGISLLFSNLQPASALGCYSGMDWLAEGPYPSSAQGFVSVENMTVNKLNSNRVYSIFTVEPGTEAKVKFSYFETAPGATIINFTLKPVVDMRDPSTAATQSWLNIAFEPSVVVVPVEGSVNITMTLKVSKDAPLGNYTVKTYGERQDSDEYERTQCPYAPLEFPLRVVQGKNATETITQRTTVTETTTLTTTTTATSSETIVDPSILAWAIGATVVAVVLAVVLLLERRITPSRPK